MIRRGPSFYRGMQNVHPVSMSWLFSIFCFAYAHLSKFRRALRHQKLKFVITENDPMFSTDACWQPHTNRVANPFALQYSSVSSLFPALRLNCTFLDSQCALDTYRECENNQSATQRKVPLPKVAFDRPEKAPDSQG